ncbi:hypothetical protein GPECTOR_49g534 [Gonium pectorale]|uniref:Uncharacterized protein n=1 Tax=Gonium pectorale TaxID=33097 RepID=A0A150G9B5_GONPE|nr:hypothetical protein GPECTOR_49g534 [Gonium pectorale]|eukprot:KXZ45950.1 hypothetical protein GPECTOR_49g534 [Gonium pectorale]
MERYSRGPSPDWQAKVEWLEAQGLAKSCDAFSKAVKRPDAPERFAWLMQQGYPMQTHGGSDNGSPLVAAAAAGDGPAVFFLA